MKNLLFITWDGPQTSYMEGLFMPIFQEIAKQGAYQFHVVQFTWAEDKKIAHTQAAADKMGITYSAWPVLRKPNVSIGSLLTVLTSAGKIKKYIRENNIHIVMPRSTFPAMMVNQINSPFASRAFFPFRGLRGAAFFPFRGLRGAGKVPFRGFRVKLIFDADGLPIDERVDFAGLKKNNWQYRWMKSIETSMLKRADKVITRSQKSVEVHLENIGEQYRNKFSVVFNGRDAETFQNSESSRAASRKQLGLREDELLFVYCGSLGEQYCWEEMMTVFEGYQKTAPAKILVLTGNKEYALSKLSAEQQKSVIVKSVPFPEIPFWLSAGDIAFALRTPSFSMQGVAPIKLGEYLLMNLPTIASKGIGDTEEILKHFKDCYLYDHTAEQHLRQSEILNWIENVSSKKNINTREQAEKWFSLDAAAISYLKALQL